LNFAKGRAGGRGRNRSAAFAGAALLIGLTLAAVPGCAGGGGGRVSPSVVAPTADTTTTETWEFDGRPGQLVRTKWYRLFTTARDTELVRQMPIFLERALDHYTTAMGPLPRPPMKLDTFLMGDRDEWVVLTKQVMGDDAGTYLRIQRGGFSSGGRGLFWTIGRHDTMAIAAHEGWHQYTQRTFRQELPAWLEEGVAVFMEGFVMDPASPDHPIFLGWANTERHDHLRRAAARRRLVPLEELLTASPQDLINRTTDGTLTYYAQVWALVHFLREGDEKMRRGLSAALADAASGRLRATVEMKTGSAHGRGPINGADVFRAYINPDLEAASRDYDAFITRIVRPGNRTRISRGEPPLMDQP